MRRYEEIRETHRHELLSREAEIAEKIPGITALDDRAAAASIAAAKRRIASPEADLGMTALCAAIRALLTARAAPVLRKQP